MNFHPLRRTFAALVCLVFIMPSGALWASQPSAQSTALRDVELLKRYAAALPIGATVRVRVVTGERLRAVLMQVDGNAIVIRPKTRIPEPTRQVPFEQLDTLELEGAGGARGTAVLIGVGSAVATFVSLWLVALAVIDD